MRMIEGTTACVVPSIIGEFYDISRLEEGNMLRVELKRIIKSHRNQLIFASSILLAIVMAVAPISFITVQMDNKLLKGSDAIRFYQDAYKASYGDVTPDKLKAALVAYQKYNAKYGGLENGMPDPEIFPMDLYNKKLLPMEPLISLITRNYCEASGGIVVPRSIDEIDPDEMDHFYEEIGSLLDKFAYVEKAPNAQREKVQKMYDRVDKPFYISGFYDIQAMEYLYFHILFAVLIGVILSATIFSSDYESGADQIIRCTKNGRIKIASFRILSIMIVNIALYGVEVGIHLAISYHAFGTEWFETSIQTLGSGAVITMNLCQLHKAMIIGGVLSLLAGVSMSIFISSKVGKSVMAIAISFLFAILPLFAFVALGGNNWLTAILPTGGVGISSGLFNQIIDYRFLNIGSFCFWTPQVTITFTLCWIPVLIFFSLKSYCNHRI
jgi:hypothetical protein